MSDPAVHTVADQQLEDLDLCWVLCHRPRINVGGELTGSMLDLTHERTSGEYLTPLQMKANNGVIIIDDLGRQASLQSSCSTAGSCCWTGASTSCHSPTA